MKKNLTIAALSLALGIVLGTASICPAQGKKTNDSLLTESTFKGTLHVGKIDSFFVYVGEESGDFAAFCFTNNSDVGRTVLHDCRDGDICQFTGKVDQSTTCKVDKATQDILSGSGKIISVKSIKMLSPSDKSAATKTATPSNQAKISGIRDVDFLNFSYRTAFGEPQEKTVKLSSGKFEDGGTYENGGSLYELLGQPAYGDLNGDKSDDAVVEIKLSGAPTYRAFEVHAYTFQNGQPKILARIDNNRVLTDYQKYYPNADIHYAGINAPKIQNGHVIVEALADGSFACPKYTATFDYMLTRGKFVLSGKPSRKQFNCN